MSGGQVKSGHYKFKSYVTNERWDSYYYQIKEALECSHARRILVIGVGDGIVPNIIRSMNHRIEVETFDIDETLKPDICGDIAQLSSIIKHQYDVIICCQVCEHIEFNRFDEILAELKDSITAGGGRLVLSLPIRYFPVTVWLDFPKFHVHYVKRISKFWEKGFTFDGQHYWEIGSKKYSKNIVRKKIIKYFRVVREYHVPNNPYHYFYICDI